MDSGRQQAGHTHVSERTEPPAAGIPEAVSSVTVSDSILIERGTAHLLFAFDIGLSVDLDEVQRRIKDRGHRPTIPHKRRAPQYFTYQPAPVRMVSTIEAATIDGWSTETEVDIVIYDFGAVSIQYRLPLRGTLQHLVQLSDSLYDNDLLIRTSRKVVDKLMKTITPAVTKPCVPDRFEDYVIYQFEAIRPAVSPDQAVADHAAVIAQILRAEKGPISRMLIDDALNCRIAFGNEDMVIVDWNAAVIFDPQAEDVRAVLEFANVELLEMRFLDDQLDRALDESYRSFASGSWGRWRNRAAQADLRRIAELQLDSALLFEEVNNSIKLLGDQYLARVYRLAGQRLHLEEWDTSILRKLNTLESLYQKMSDQQIAWRMEVLEWIIIVLIAVSILISLPYS